MKLLFIIFLAIFFLKCPAVTYDLGNPVSPAQATVLPQGNEIFISCRFAPRKDFTPAINASIDSQRARELCRKSLLLYWKVPKGQQVNIYGLHNAGPIKKIGKEVEYSFAIPMQNPIIAQTIPDGEKKSSSKTDNTPSLPSITEKPKSVSKREDTLTVIRYLEHNGVVQVNETKEYHPAQFASRAEYDRFCKEMFERINLQHQQNMQKIIQQFEAERNRVLHD